MKTSTIVIIAAALVGILLVFRNSTNPIYAGATSHGAGVAGGVPGLLNSPTTAPATWIASLEGLFGGIGGAANGINESSGSIVPGGAATVQANANAAGFGSGGSTGGFTAAQLAGATQVEASDENLVSLIQSGGITTASVPVASTLDETEALGTISTPSYDNSMLPLSGGYNANDYSSLLA